MTLNHEKILKGETKIRVSTDYIHKPRLLSFLNTYIDEQTKLSVASLNTTDANIHIGAEAMAQVIKQYIEKE